MLPPINLIFTIYLHPHSRDLHGGSSFLPWVASTGVCSGKSVKVEYIWLLGHLLQLPLNCHSICKFEGLYNTILDRQIATGLEENDDHLRTNKKNHLFKWRVQCLQVYRFLMITWGTLVELLTLFPPTIYCMNASMSKLPEKISGLIGIHRHIWCNYFSPNTIFPFKNVPEHFS